MTREEAKEALSVLKIYDAQWLREAIDMAIEALSVAELKSNFESAVPNCQKCAIKELWKATEKEDLVSVVRCNDCKWYQGVHGVQGHAPCEWFNKQVLWNDFCSNGEPYKGGDTE